MSEKLMNRVRRLVSGAIYDGVEAVEAAMPEATMREAIREFDRTIEELREEMSKVQSERHIAGKRIKLSQEKIDTLATKIDTALQADREDLAQAAVERQMDLEVQIPVLEKTQQDASEKVAELSSYIDALRGRKAEMQEDLSAFQAARSQSQLDTDGVDGTCVNRDHEKRAERAENAFDRVMRNATGIDSIGKSDRETVSKLAELEVMERKNKIAARLDAHRQNIKDVKAS